MRTHVPKALEGIPPEASRVFEGVLFDVYQWEQKLFDGSTATFEKLRRPDTVMVIAVKDDKIVVLEEEQPGSGKYLTLPGGRHDNDAEDELQAAQRELLEETGMRFANWKLLKATQPHPKIDWVVYIFLATECIDQVETRPDAGEKISVMLKSIEEIKALNVSDYEHKLGDGLIEKVSSVQELTELPLLC